MPIAGGGTIYTQLWDGVRRLTIESSPNKEIFLFCLKTV